LVSIGSKTEGSVRFTVRDDVVQRVIEQEDIRVVPQSVYAIGVTVGGYHPVKRNIAVKEVGGRVYRVADRGKRWVAGSPDHQLVACNPVIAFEGCNTDICCHRPRRDGIKATVIDIYGRVLGTDPCKAVEGCN